MITGSPRPGKLLRDSPEGGSGPAAAMTVTRPPTELRMQRMGATLLFLQPVKDGKPAGASLMVDLQSGNVGMAEHSMPLQSLGDGTASPERIWGIIGLAKLVDCAVLAVITNAEQVPMPSLASFVAQ